MKKLETSRSSVPPVGEIIADTMRHGVRLGMQMAATGATEEQVDDLVRETFPGVREGTAKEKRAQLTEREVILDERECANLLGIAFESFQDLRRRGEGPPFTRIGKGKIVYLKTRVIEWLDANQVFGEKKESQ
jgi:hypothetical protein